MTVQELTKIAMRVQCDGRYAAAGHDGKMLWSSTFTQLGYARQYVSGCDTWVIVDDYAVVEQSENPHADYPGGADQYREDVATLAEAGAWRLEPSDLPCDDPVVNVAEDAWNDIVNTLDAAARFMPWALAQLGGA